MTASPDIPKPSNPDGAFLHAAERPHSLWWSYVSLLTRIVVQIGCTAILSRILSPADYGLVAMLGTLMVVLALVGEMGLDMVTMQRARLTLGEVHNLFFFNLTFGVGAAVSCVALAPFVAKFYGKPELQSAALIAAFSFPFAAICVQPLALLRRAVRLKDMFIVEAGGSFAGAVTGIVLALRWHSYRALLVQSVVSQAFRAGLSLWKSGYRPARPRNIRDSLGHLRGGAWRQVFQLLTTVFRTFDNVLIGAYSGASQLGLYTRAYYLTSVPSQFTVGTLGESALPKITLARNSSGDFARVYRRQVKAAACASMPIAVIMACAAPELIHFLYGPRWSGVNRLLAVMSLTTALQPLYESSYWLLLSAGKFRLMAAIGAINCAVLVSGFMIGIRGGALGVAEAYGSVMVVLTLTTLAWTHRSVGASLRATFADLQWPVITSALLVISLLAIRYLDRRLDFTATVALVLLTLGSGLTIFLCAVTPIAARLFAKGKSLRSITPRDVVSEARIFLGYQT